MLYPLVAANTRFSILRMLPLHERYQRMGDTWLPNGSMGSRSILVLFLTMSTLACGSGDSSNKQDGGSHPGTRDVAIRSMPSYTNPENKCSAVDILFMIDNSASMKPKQVKLA